MKKIRTRWMMWVNSVLTAMLALFTSCNEGGKPDIDDGGGMICMYGVPQATYQVSGEVTDEKNQPLESIQVIVTDNHDYWNNDTTYTNAEGKYLGETTLTSFGKDTLHVIVHDTTGVYASDSVAVPPAKMKQTEDGSWTDVYTAEVDFKLKKK